MSILVLEAISSVRGRARCAARASYKEEILPYWRFRTHKSAYCSAKKILNHFYKYKKKEDFVGIDMAPKFFGQ